MTTRFGAWVFGLGLVCAAAGGCGEPFEHAPGTGGAGAGGDGAGGSGADASCSPGETAPCYDGPVDTENVGICKGGTKVCNADGNGFGECQGATTPSSADDCTTPEDENCDGAVNDGCPCEPGDVEACYSGPAGTADVGVCASGTHSCGDDASWGACTGELLPTTDTCGNDQDEDCDGFDCSQTVWAQLIGSPDGESAEDVATDAAGNIYLGGGFSGALQLGNLPSMLSGGDSDVFVAKLSQDGSPTWSVGFGGVENQRLYQLVADSDGNVFAAGSYGGQMAAGGTVLSGSSTWGVFLCKILDGGTVDWLVRPWGDDAGQFRAIALDSGGNPVIAGAYDTAPPGETDASGASIAKYSPAGQLLWRESVTGSDDVTINAVTVDAADNIIVAGSYVGTLQLGDKPLPSAAVTRGFIGKLNSSGVPILLVSFGGTDELRFRSIAMAPSGDLLVSGSFRGTAKFGPTTIVSAGEGDIFVASISPAGGAVWAKRYGGASSDLVSELGTDSVGNIVLAGAADDGLTFGGDVFTGTGWGGMYVAKLDPQGNHLWSRGFDGDLLDIFYGVAVGLDDTVTVAGGTYSSLDFGTGLLANHGAADAAVVKIAP